MSCYGDGNGEFELNFHVISVAYLSTDSVLDENSDKAVGKGLLLFRLARLFHPGPQHDSLVCGVA